MTMTESRTSRNGHDDQPSLADQLVMSSAGIASQGLSTSRQILTGLVDAIDTLVTGVFTAGREAWTAGIGGIKTAVSEL